MEEQGGVVLIRRKAKNNKQQDERVQQIFSDRRQSACQTLLRQNQQPSLCRGKFNLCLIYIHAILTNGLPNY